MKVKNTSKRVIKLLNGKDKVTLIPGTDDTFDVSDCDDVQFLIAHGDLIEVAGKAAGASKPGRKSKGADGGDDKTSASKPDDKGPGTGGDGGAK